MHVLLIEDNEDDAELIRTALCEQASHDISLDWADRLETGLSKLMGGPVDAVLVDLSLPDSHGLETLDRVRPQAGEAAVIVLTGLDNELVAEKSLLRGAQDYLVKGRLTGDALRRAIRYAMGRHRVEQALRKSEERFHLTCLATQDGIWDWDIASGTTWFNEAYQSVYEPATSHLERHQIPWADQVHQEDREAVIANLTRVLESDQHLWTAEYRFRRNDGTYAYVVDHGYVLRDREHRPHRMIGAKTDITERRQAETMHAVQLAVGLALEESVTLSEAVPRILRAICELQGWTVGALWLVDPQDQTLHCNALWHRASAPIEAFAKSYESLSLTQHMGLAGRAWRTGTAVFSPDILMEAASPAREAARQADLHGAIAFPISTRKNILGIIECFVSEVLRPTPARLERISELGAMISQFLNRKDLERQLRQAQKMEALGRMAGGVAHDFNNLLTIINSWAELLMDEPGLTSRAQRGMAQIRDAGNKATGLTRQLLAFTRHQIVERQPLNLNDRVSDIVELMKRVIGEDIQLVLKLDPTLGRIKADAGQIEQVVMNLVVNARDAMPHGGRLELETGEVTVTHSDPFWSDPLIPGPYVTLAVRDTGCGMSVETLGHLFEPFFTTKELGKGTGLGLSTVYGIVRQSGGTVGITSELGKGTTFTIYLPRIAEDSEALRPPATTKPAGERSETILLVEDNEMVRGLAHTILVAQHYHVVAARSGEEALRLVRDQGRQIALLVTDMVMPGMGGAQLASELQALQPDLKVILTSGYSERDGVLLQHFDARMAFLPKPYTPESLTKAVATALESPAQQEACRDSSETP
ncbi:MAG: response regulator [Nitrospira sp.]|uniref:histidine kinase n=1 Tax=Nitrospira defluvii TaxID=330214 RepID=A0ABM8SDH7_9BACT|nr:response regulator [Nitrospira defluvii]MCS6326822.1 response regulator [Nitrospira sp.]CAE6802934.1 Putative Hybrid sensor histidine kinase [Nitrospira defluvii]